MRGEERQTDRQRQTETDREKERDRDRERQRSNNSTIEYIGENNSLRRKIRYLKKCKQYFSPHNQQSQPIHIYTKQEVIKKS